MKTKKASVILMSLAIMVILGFLSSIGFIISQKMSGNDDLDVFDGNSSYDGFDEQEQQYSQAQDSSTPSFNFGPIKILAPESDDSSVPDSISDLEVGSKGSTWIYWTWENPDNSDFKECIIYVAGKRLVTNHNHINVTGLQPNREYTITVNTKDDDGNINDDDISDTERTLTKLDNTVPASITDLVALENDTTWIYWTWTNPSDEDFSESIIFIDGDEVAATSDNFYRAEDLLPNTNYTITVHTRDTSGNENIADVSNTAGTKPDSTIPSAVGGLRLVSRTAYTLKWEWTNPKNDDFKENVIFLNGVSIGVLNDTITSYQATSLRQNTQYTFVVRSRDTSGNLGSPATNSTKTCTQECSYGHCWNYC